MSCDAASRSNTSERRAYSRRRLRGSSAAIGNSTYFKCLFI